MDQFLDQDDIIVKLPGIPFTENASAVTTRAQVHWVRELVSMQTTVITPVESTTNRRTQRRRRKDSEILSAVD